MILNKGFEWDDIDYALEREITSMKHSKKRKDLEGMQVRTLQPGSECSLTDVADELASAGVDRKDIRLDINQFREQLTFSLNNHDIVLEKQTFPRRKRPSDINISVTGRHDLNWPIGSGNTAASIVTFVREFTAWIPSYMQVEEEVRTREKQKSIACDIAMTLLEENIGGMLKEKGYSFRIISRRNTATITVKISESVDFSINVDLLSDFIADAQSLVEQLKPIKTT